MGVRAAWQALWQTKDSRSRPLLAVWGADKPAPTPREYDKLAKEGYVANWVVYRCVNLISESAAAIPWQLFRGKGANRDQIEEHPLLNLLSNPNPIQGGAELFQAVYGFRLLAGNSYIEGVAPDGGPNAGQPQELWTLRPDRMQVVKSETGMPRGYVYSAAGQKVTWDAEELRGRSPILHSRSFHPLDDWYGLSPLEAAAYEIDMHNAAGAWNYGLLKNSARPSGALTYDPKDGVNSLTEEQRSALRSSLDEQAKNAGRPLLLEGGLDWKQMGLSPIDADWLRGRDMSARDIAMAYDVPPQLVGIEGSQTFANFEQARLSLYEDAVLPLVDSYKDDLNRWLTPLYGDSSLELSYDEDAIPALAPRRKARWETVQGSDFLTVNEKRQATGYDGIEGGDVVLVEASKLPLGFELPEADENDEEEDEEEERALAWAIEEAKSGGFEYKLLTDRQPGARQREQAIQERLRGAFERALAKRIGGLIEGAVRAAARAFRTGGSQGVNFALQDHPAELERVLRAHYDRVMNVFGQRIRDAAKSTYARERKDEQSDFLRRILELINGNSGPRAREISDTTFRQIREAIAEGEDLGESIPQIVKRIREKAGGLNSALRATVIARTETHWAGVAAGEEAVKAADLTDSDVVREWIAAEDGRTRASHNDADGQHRGMDEPFDVGGVKLMFPGDPKGPPRETIRCRCVIGYVPRDEL